MKFYTLLIIAFCTSPGYAQGHALSVGDVFCSYLQTPKENTLALNGSYFDSVKYNGLYNILGTGKLPDWRGRLPIGVGQGAGLKFTYEKLMPAGKETHILTVPELANHTHDQFAYVGKENKEPIEGRALPVLQSTVTNLYDVGSPTISVQSGTIASTGSDTPFPIIPPVQPVYWFIVCQ